MTASQNVIPVKLSSKRASANKFVWNIGISREFYNRLPENRRRISITARDKQLTINLGNDGVKFALTGSTAWAGSISNKFMDGLKKPNMALYSVDMEGEYDPKSNTIKVLSRLPELVYRSMEDHEVPEDQPDEPAGGSVTESSTAFSEPFDIEEVTLIKGKEGEGENDDSLQSFAEYITDKPQDENAPHTLEEVLDRNRGEDSEEGGNYHSPVPWTLPEHLEKWSDENVTNLKLLLNDMMGKRHDIHVTMTEEGHIRFRKQVFVDM